jgi:hypothetical protein
MLQEMPAVTWELVNDLFDENEESSSLASDFSLKVPVILVAWQKYRASSSELVAPACVSNALQEFPQDGCS